MLRSGLLVLLGGIGAFVAILVTLQLIQEFQDRKNAATIQGIILDQNGKPLSGVTVNFKAWNWRWFVPIPFTPTWTAERPVKAVSGQDGTFHAKTTLPRTKFVSAKKSGYQQDGPELEYMWESLTNGPRRQWTLHLFEEALIRDDQLKSLDYESLAFSRDEQICFDLVMGKVVPTPSEADLVFRWERLPASNSHGEYGKFIITAPKGGVWFWEQEREFAPAENYEHGMVFFFGPESLRAYMKRRRAEMFLKSRDGQVYARIYFQLDTEKSTLSIRGRLNSSANRYVGSKANNYAIGVYGSLSPSYLNPGVPWWIPIDPPRGQVILSPEHAQFIFSEEPSRMRFPAYFAGHHKTPVGVLEAMALGKLAEDHYVPRALAKNFAAPSTALMTLKTNAASWKAKEVQATLTAPQDLKEFLTRFD